VLYDFLKANEDKLRSALPNFKDARVPQLQKLLREMKKKHNFFKIEDVARKYDIEILRLPPWNCDLNPIELVWKDVKKVVEKGNPGTGNMTALQNLTESALRAYRNIPAWYNSLEHVEK
jgi:hypothetical protein